MKTLICLITVITYISTLVVTSFFIYEMIGTFSSIMWRSRSSTDATMFRKFHYFILNYTGYSRYTSLHDIHNIGRSEWTISGRDTAITHNLAEPVGKGWSLNTLERETQVKQIGGGKTGSKATLNRTERRFQNKTGQAKYNTDHDIIQRRIEFSVLVVAPHDQAFYQSQ